MRTISFAVATALLLFVGAFARAGEQTTIKLAQAAPAPGAPAAEPAAPAAPPAQKLLGIAAWNQLVGNSISGKDGDETLVEYITLPTAPPSR